MNGKTLAIYSAMFLASVPVLYVLSALIGVGRQLINAPSDMSNLLGLTATVAGLLLMIMYGWLVVEIVRSQQKEKE